MILRLVWLQRLFIINFGIGFVDECIEKSKKGQISHQALVQGLITFLKLLHPFIPFVTETIWQSLIKEKIIKDNQPLALTNWPINLTN